MTEQTKTTTFAERQAAAAAAMKAAGVDQTKVVSGGGDGPLPPPAEGFVKLRLVQYIELGKVTGEYKGTKKVKNEAMLVFELSGPKHAPRETEGGKVPQRITMYVNLSQHEKAGWPKLFRALNWEGKATHIVELIGSAYVGTVMHRKFKRKDGTDAVAAELVDKVNGMYTIRPPRLEVVNEETGDVEYKAVAVADPIMELKMFVWDAPTIEDWNSLYIDGTYDEVKDAAGKVTMPARSKNSIQARVLKANNFKGSLLEELLVNNGTKLDIPDAEQLQADEDDAAPAQDAPWSAPAAAPTGKAADDALNDIVY